MADFAGRRHARVMKTREAMATRATPPQTAWGSVVRAYGSTFADPGVGGTLDVPLAVAQLLSANGWAIMGLVGTTAERPSKTDADWRNGGGAPLNGRYFDTSLGVWLIHDEASATKWLNATTFRAA